MRSVLLSARYNKDEIDTAMMVLRENTITKETHVDGLHKVFRTDEALHSSEISKLLGVEVDVREKITVKKSPDTFTVMQFVVLWTVSVILAVSTILFYMYSKDMGLFHPTSNMGLLNGA